MTSHHPPAIVSAIGVCVAIALALSPAAPAQGSAQPASGVVGTVSSYPSCGVPFPTCTDGHVPSDPVRVRRRADRRIVAQTRTDSAGHFRITLSPGAYQVEARTNNFPTAGRWVVRPVTVRRHRVTQIALVYDNGIR